MTALMILLKASILMSFAALIQALIGRRMSAAARHLMWTLAIAGLLLLPALSFVLPAWTAFTTTVRETSVPVPAMLQNSSEIRRPVDGTVVERLDLPTVPSTIRWADGFMILYLAGVLVLLARLIKDRIRIRQLLRHTAEVNDPQWNDPLLECARRAGFQQTVRLLRSRDEIMPMAFGIRRPAIVIPAIADTWTRGSTACSASA